MDEARKKLFEHSDRILGKLQLLSVYFEDELIIRIYIRSQVIHRIFESNPELDVNKLDLFHVQFTETIIALLKKIKQNNEKLILSLDEERHLNEELISRIGNSMRGKDGFEEAQQQQEQKINTSLSRLYENLSGFSAQPPMAKNIRAFSEQYATDFFPEIPAELYEDLSSFEAAKVYRNDYATIDRKLMGNQCRAAFHNEFICGFRTGTHALEVYKLSGTDEFFLFSAERQLFLHCSASQLEQAGMTDMRPRQARIIQELRDKNTQLLSRSLTAKTQIPAAVHDLLTDYYAKISGIDFLDLIDDYDIQANILKTMLNTDLM